MFDPKLKEALGRVQKPGRYTGGEPGSVYKDKEKVDVRFAFCFPDTYEVGMSFLGEKILYELLNSHENWWCERAFMPWLDMKAEMERLGLPLYTMGTTKFVGGANSFRSLMIALVMRAGMPGSLGVMAFTRPSS